MILPITGNVRSRFLEVAVLLQLLDPVRGEPSAHGLDQDSHESGIQREASLKRKFLDSFALICAINRDGASVSAACMENLSDGTAIRIASNGGISDNVLARTQELVNILNEVASSSLDASNAETDVLLKLIELDLAKIKHYLKNIAAFKDIYEEPMDIIEMRLRESSSSFNVAPSSLTQFLEWLRQLFTVNDLLCNSDINALSHHVRWAEKARQYLDLLKIAFPQQRSRWISSILKLGRYSIASKCFVRCAREFPALFNPMRVERIPAPASTSFTVAQDHLPLKTVLRRVVGDQNTDDFISRLGRIWNTENPEAHFRRACSLNLVVHAEMQLLAFYDYHSELKPMFRFMGVSKKSCYLCHRFLMIHPESFAVSSCHQKLYTSWIPPPSADSTNYKRYKSLTIDLSKAMESIAKQDLMERLSGGPRRPVPPDSTAGVSLSGLATPNIARAKSPVSILRSRYPISNYNEKRVADVEPSDEIAQVSLPDDLETPDIGPAYGETAHMASLTEEQHLETNITLQVASMVFHLMRADDSTKQDIVCMENVMCPQTKQPSWAQLVGIIEQEDGFGLGFREGRDFILVNRRIRVANGRQFLASLQYLQNLKIWSSEVLVDSFDNLKQKEASSMSDSLGPSKKRKELPC